MAADHERAQLVSQSLQKFRKAIRLRPEFDRACYNLGTVYYSHAHTLSSSSAAQLSSQLTKASVEAAPLLCFTNKCPMGRGLMQGLLQINAPACKNCTTSLLGSIRRFGTKLQLDVQDRQRERQERAEDEEIEYTFKLAALYITLAFALQPKRDVYKRSLKVSVMAHS